LLYMYVCMSCINTYMYMPCFVAASQTRIHAYINTNIHTRPQALLRGRLSSRQTGRGVGTDVSDMDEELQQVILLTSSEKVYVPMHACMYVSTHVSDNDEELQQVILSISSETVYVPMHAWMPLYMYVGAHVSYLDDEELQQVILSISSEKVYVYVRMCMPLYMYVDAYVS
jgi:hypothetical protein